MDYLEKINRGKKLVTSQHRNFNKDSSIQMKVKEENIKIRFSSCKEKNTIDDIRVPESRIMQGKGDSYYRKIERNAKIENENLC